MRVVLSTSGVFHTFALARELERRQYLTRIYSGYPLFKLKRERVSPRLIRTFPWLLTPLMRLPSAFPWRVARDLWYLHIVAMDLYVRSRLDPCDVFVGLSGSGLLTGIRAQQRGARYICDRGSTHIVEQDALLHEEYRLQSSYIPGLRFGGIDPRGLEREQAEYAQADLITVPSTFVLRSFIKRGVPADKLRLVPYGVDLSIFHPTGEPSREEFRVLFTGSVSVRKGFVYLAEAFDRLRHPRKHLDVIGNVAPELVPYVATFSQRWDVTFHGHVPQHRLKHFMSTSSVMVLPSIEEGLAMVQAQALACACPLISTFNTGAEDLIADGVEGYIVEPRNASVIAERLQQVADSREVRDRLSAAALTRVQQLGGWTTYGERMLEVLEEAVALPAWADRSKADRCTGR
jgi:starch synthase